MVGATKVKLSAITIIAFMACVFITLFLLQGRGEDLFCDEASDDYAMMFALQYTSLAYLFKVDNNLVLWVCRGPTKSGTATEEDFSNPGLDWRSTQITQEDFDYLLSLTREAQPKRESSHAEGLVLLGAWILTVFYDSSTFHGGIGGVRFESLTEKLVELSPIRVDLTVWGGS